MNTPIFNPDQFKQAESAKVSMLQTQLKLATWKRNITIAFTDQTQEIFPEYDASETRDGFVILFKNEDNTIIKIPAKRILRITELLISPK